jgi:hypothetical protein
MRKFGCLALVMLFGFAAAGLPALPEDLLFRWDVRFWGGDVALGWKGWDIVPGVDTILWASVGGAWQNNFYFAGDDELAPPLDTVSYGNWNADWRFGVAQGILFNPEQDRNLLELLLLYRGKVHHYSYDNLVLAGLPEEDGLLQHSLTAGLLFDNTAEDKPSLNMRGLYSVLSAEFAPEWLGNDVLGLSDFWRLCLGVTGYLPVLDTPTVSIYLADRVLFDWIFGEDGMVPVSTLGASGALSKVPIGSNPRRALGGAMRGIYGGRFDGYVKLINNFDVRLHFPAWTLFRTATPMLVAYFDAGVYDALTRSLRFDPVYCATGLGAGLYAWGFDFIFYGTYFLNEGRLSWELGMGTHF